MKKKYGQSKGEEFEYDVSLSFAGEDRKYVDAVARQLKSKGVRVFYDGYEKIELWGKNLYEHLDDIYKNAARYCVIFISKDYSKKLWTNHERRSAQARALREHAEYILPARFDKTELPGLPDTVGYLDLRKIKPRDLADLIEKKIDLPKENFFPPSLDMLYKKMRAKTKVSIEKIDSDARHFYHSLTRLTEDEKLAVFLLFLTSCPSDLSENVHREADYIRRASGFPISKLSRLYSGLISLGFYFKSSKMDNHSGDIFLLEFHNVGVDFTGNATFVAHEIVSIVSKTCCEKHVLERLMRLDFSSLSKTTSLNKNSCKKSATSKTRRRK